MGFTFRCTLTGVELASPRCGVEVLQEVVRRKLDLLVPPFRCTVDAHAIKAVRCTRRKSPYTNA